MNKVGLARSYVHWIGETILFQNWHHLWRICFLLIMGCASSKQKRCRRCNAPYSPAPRSCSMHVHHPPQTEGDSYHVVALTSTTLGTLKLSSPASTQSISGNCGHDFKLSNGKVGNAESFRFDSESFVQRLEEKETEKKSEALEKERKEEFSMGLIEAKTWSSMIEQKLPKVFPKTPIRTPPGEPETINAWELMEGLEDTTPFRSPSHFRSFSFDVNGDDVGGGGDVDVDVDVDPPKMSVVASPKPMWLLMTEEESRLNPAVSDFDPEVISSFRKSLQRLSPDSPFHLQPAPSDEEKQGTRKGSPFEEKKTKGGDDDVVVDCVKVDDPCGKDKVVLYFTSLRGVRKTYEDCCQVRLILKGLGVRVDDRDVSMHSGFKEELRELLGDRYGGLPRVFVGGNYIGGAEEIQRLHEDGKLEKLLGCCEKIEDSVGGDGGGVCEACGDIRFVPCETCCGSCKIYYEGEENEEECVDGEVGECGFQRCPDCNENGLIRCPMCCY
ncbi:electron carrier [Spatholobus suberectus]|nr:electron carrier [Spatholobus suberectus]